MQNAKDTFYEVLRDRVAAANPGRTVVVRGVTRPAVVVEENELAESGELLDCFRLRWTALGTDHAGPAVRWAMVCEVRYSTKGASAAAGTVTARGRALATLDAELSAAVGAAPRRARKKNFAATATGGQPVTMGSDVWWGDLLFGAAESTGAVLERVARVTVWSYQELQEAGEA